MPTTPSRLRVLVALVALLSGTRVLHPLAALGGPVLGFREEFAGSSFGNWQSPWELGNPGTGGVGGNGDGFLTVITTAGFLGVKTSDSNYIGDYNASGVTQIRFWVKDISGQENLQIHLAIGNQLNFWQFNPGVVPAADRWLPYEVDLVESNFTQIIGTGSFHDALATTDRILVRHDLPPFTKDPDPVTATLGIDHILLTNGTVGVGAAPARSGGSIRLSAPRPNPVRGPATFTIEVPGSEQLTLRVIDVTGRVVWSELSSGGLGTNRSWTWDGRSAIGRRVPPGRYVLEASGAHGRDRRAFSLLR